MRTSRHAYPNARISILASRLLSEADLEALVLTDVPPAVESPSARILLAALGDPDAASREVEQALLAQLLREISIITRPLEGTARDFISHVLHRFELANVKSMIRGIFGGVPRQIVREQLADLHPFDTLPIDALLGTEDAAEFLRRLERTALAEIARHARRALEEQHDLFSVEAAIDRRYQLGLRGRALMVPAEERQAVIGLMGAVLDEYALVSLLRYRFAYGLSPAKTYYLLVGSPGALGAERLQALVQLGSIEEVVAALPHAVREWLHATESTAEIEDGFARRTRETARRALRDTRAPTARAFAFLLLKDEERRRALAIFKGRRLGFDPALMRVAARIAA